MSALQRFRISLPILVLAASIIGGCGQHASTEPADSIRDEAAAIKRALELTDLREPITVTGVEQGRAGELVIVPTGFVPNEQEGARELAKRQRPAWAVTLVGLFPSDCGAEVCPLVPTQHQIAIDRTTGEALLQVIGGDIDQ